jgi:hypothetical protein
VRRHWGRPTRRDAAALGIACVALAAVSIVAACGGDDSDAETSLPSSRGSGERHGTGATESASPEEQATAAYEEGQTYLSDLLGHRPPDPLDSGLETYFSGEALAGSRDVVSGLLSDNQYAESTVTTDPDVVEASEGSVVLDDCLHEDVRRYDVTTGEMKSSGSASYNLHVTVLAADGAWKVDQIEIREEECTP